jgi:hypothetical protein
MTGLLLWHTLVVGRMLMPALMLNTCGMSMKAEHPMSLVGLLRGQSGEPLIQ